jgi:hypothetical protein
MQETILYTVLLCQVFFNFIEKIGNEPCVFIIEGSDVRFHADDMCLCYSFFCSPKRSTCGSANRADNPPRVAGSGSSLVQPRVRGAMNTKGYPRDSATAQAAAEQRLLYRQ